MSPVEICGIVGSPNENGNVDLLVSRVLQGARSQGADTQTLYLNDLDIKACQDCSTDPYPAYCLIDDDMAEVHAALDLCDGIVLGTPIYFNTVSAQTKLMIDRCNCLMPFVEGPNGTYGFERRMKKRKRGVFVAVAGTAQEFDTVLVTVKAWFDWANIELVETILYGHDTVELGEVRKDEERMAQAFEAGVKLASRSSGARPEAG